MAAPSPWPLTHRPSSVYQRGKGRQLDAWAAELMLPVTTAVAAGPTAEAYLQALERRPDAGLALKVASAGREGEG